MEINMLDRVQKCVLTLAVAGIGATFVGSKCLAVPVDVFYTGPVGGSWHTGSNWSDTNVPSNLGDSYFIRLGLTATYSTGTSSIAKLRVSDDSTGSLNVTGGRLITTGGGDSFVI